MECVRGKERKAKSFRHHLIRSIFEGIHLLSILLIMCTLDQWKIVSMAIAPTVTQLWRCTPMQRQSERESQFQFLIRSSSLIASRAVIKIYFIIKIYWAPIDVPVNSIRFGSFCCAFCCHIITINYRFGAPNCKSVYCYCYCCAVFIPMRCHAPAEAEKATDRCRNVLFFFASSISNFFMTSLEFIPFWYLVSDNGWWISYFVQQQQ